MAKEPGKHTWRFFRAGGFDQVVIDSADDLMALGELDQKLWVALACPTDGLELDAKTLEYVDADKDGRIRAPELLAALAWTGEVLADRSTLLKGSAKLPLAAIADNAEGKRILASARRILKNLGKKDAADISVAQMADTAKTFAEMKLNGDGVVPPTSADDEALQKTLTDILAVMGGEKDRSGADGVTQEKVDAFFTEATAYCDWQKAAEKDPATLPLGEGTAAAFELFTTLKPKIDDYFTRTRMVAFDDRAGAALNRDPAEYATLAPRLLHEGADELASFPLAKVEAGRSLPLSTGINPAWRAQIDTLRKTVVTPLLGEREALSEDDWAELSARLAPHAAWRAAKAGAKVESLGLPRLRALVDGDHRASLTDLITRDKALEPEANAIELVDKLVRFHRDLARLVRNFVTFADFYGKKKATFQAGTLFIDSRASELCIKVADAGAHSAIATRSGTYLAYCDLVRKGTGEKQTIAAAITDGDADNLMVGRNGLFYDRAGHDWDATIVKLVEHPISIRQAFWNPYKTVARLIGEQVEKFATSREKDVQDKAAANVADGSAAVQAAKPADKPEAPFDIGKFAGIFAAIGLALAAIGAALATVASSFLQLTWWQMALVPAGLMLLISGPSMLIAYMKLRRRNLGPMLDAAGWAVNARALVNIPFGASLTQVAKLPPGAQRSLEDPFEEKRNPWRRYVVLALLIAATAWAWKTGRLQTWMQALQTPPAATAPSGAPSASAAPAPTTK